MSGNHMISRFGRRVRRGKQWALGSIKSIALLAAAALLLGSAGNAQALTTSFGGAFGGASQPNGSNSFTLDQGYPITATSPASVLTGAIADNLLVDLNGYIGTVNGPASPVNVNTFKISRAGLSAVFDVTNAKLTQNLFQLPAGFSNGFFGGGFITGNVKLNNLLSTDPAMKLDLAPFNSGGFLVLSYNGIVAIGGVGPQPASAVLDLSPSGSFSLIAVPEPSTIALGATGVAVVVGAGLVRRRRQQLAA